MFNKIGILTGIIAGVFSTLYLSNYDVDNLFTVAVWFHCVFGFGAYGAWLDFNI